ncbi:MAG: site-specific tyrosine recombinase XerD [Ruminococcaceae bacterium]|nr:site-specific tyrosine recombinase XerD [Oscillospiraceae bacterium]
MNEMLSSFIDYLYEEKNLSENTLMSYRRDLKQYEEYVLKNGIDYLTVKKDDLNEYLSYLKELGKAPSTVSRNVASLKAFYGFLYDESVIDTNPSEGIRYNKNVRKIPGVLTGREIDKLFSQPDITTFKGLRDKAMLEVLYATGIRVSELISLKNKDINIKVGYISCSGNGTKRVIPLHDEAIDILKLYIKRHKNMFTEEGFIFVNVNGQPITRQGFWKVIKEYVKAARIKKEITPNTLRHSFAAHLIQNGADLKSIQQMLGHKDISTTQIYNNFTNSRITQIYKNAHPKAR